MVKCVAIGGLVVVWLCAVDGVTPLFAAGESSAEATAAAFIEAVKEATPFNEDIWNKPDVLMAIRKLYSQLSDVHREAVIERAGRAEDMSRWFIPSSAYVEFAVWVLQHETNAHLITRTKSTLVKHVPDIYLRESADELLAWAAKKEVTGSNEVLLLGKTGNARAVDLIVKAKDRGATGFKAAQMAALAKLGDIESTRRCIRAFRTEQDVYEKARWAWVLGYIGEAGCVMALAEERGSTKEGVWNVVPCMILGHAAILGLSQSYPAAKELWIRPKSAGSEEWRKGVSDWIAKQLNMKVTIPESRFDPCDLAAHLGNDDFSHLPRRIDCAATPKD